LLEESILTVVLLAVSNAKIYFQYLPQILSRSHWAEATIPESAEALRYDQVEGMKQATTYTPALWPPALQ